MSSTEKDIENLRRETVNMATRTSTEQTTNDAAAQSALAAETAKNRTMTWAEKVTFTPLIQQS